MSNSGKNSQTKRAKLDNFFNTSSNKASASKKHGKEVDLEDPFDLYNHTKQFYKSTEAAKDYDDQVEVGERKIKGDPLMMMNELD
jgi:hypothetical protein